MSFREDGDGALDALEMAPRGSMIISAFAAPGEHDLAEPHPQKALLDMRIQGRIAGRMRAGGVDDSDAQAIMCLLILIDALRTHNKPTFVCKELSVEVARALGIVDKVSVEVDMTHNMFIITDGAFCTVHRSLIATSTDVKRQLDVLDILAGVARDDLTAQQAIDFLNEPMHGSSDRCSLWRDWPGRILIFPVLAFSSAGSFYGGNYWDATVAGTIGLVVGVFYYGLVKILPSNRHLRSFSEMVTSFILGFLAIAASEVAKQADIELCFQSITLANLFFFLKGTDSALAFLEAIEGNFAAATQRLMHSLVGTLLLGLGVSLGVWAAWFGGPDRWDVLGTLSCKPRLGLKESACLYVFVLLMAQLDYKVDIPQMPAVFVAQLATLLSGPAESYINAPSFVATLMATALMTLIAKAMVYVVLVPEATHLADAKLSRTARRQHPDLWGMILPSIYVLSAGSSFYRSGLTAFLQGLSSNSTLFDSGVVYMGSLFAVSVAIAVGIKSAFALISAIESLTDPSWSSRQGGGASVMGSDYEAEMEDGLNGSFDEGEKAVRRGVGLGRAASEGGWFAPQLYQGSTASAGPSTRLIKQGSIGVRFVPRSGSSLFPRSRAGTASSASGNTRDRKDSSSQAPL